MNARFHFNRGVGRVLGLGSVYFFIWFILGRLVRQRRRFELNGRTALITGGSRGLGLALTREFVREGASVVLCARDPKELETARNQLAQMSRDRLGRSKGTGSFKLGSEKNDAKPESSPAPSVLAFVCDVSNRAQVEEVVKQVQQRLGRIDILVNNAGTIQVGPFEAMDEQDFRDAMEVNFYGMLHFVQALLPQWRDGKGARCVNIASIGGTVSAPHLNPYNSSKFAVVGFSTGIAAELMRYRVRVSTIAPGLMRTGSYFHARMKGQHAKEFTLFALSASLPGVSISATRAARRIVKACRYGELFVVLGTAAKTARILAALFPSLTIQVFSAVTRILPQMPGAARLERAHQNSPGWQNETALTRSPLTALGKRAAREFGQVPISR